MAITQASVTQRRLHTSRTGEITDHSVERSPAINQYANPQHDHQRYCHSNKQYSDPGRNFLGLVFVLISFHLVLRSQELKYEGGLTLSSRRVLLQS